MCYTMLAVELGDAAEAGAARGARVGDAGVLGPLAVVAAVDEAVGSAFTASSLVMPVGVRSGMEWWLAMASNHRSLF